MAERELPAIRIRFIGDAEGLRKVIADSQKEIQKLVDMVDKVKASNKTSTTINKTVKAAVKLGEEVIDASIKNLMNGLLKIPASAANITKTVKEAVKLADEFLIHYIKKLVNTIDSVRPSGANTKRTVKEAVQLTESFIIHYIKKLVNTVHTVGVSGKGVKDVVKSAVSLIQQFIIYYIKKMVDSVHTVNVKGGDVKNTVSSAVRLIRDFIVYYTKQLVNSVANVKVSAGNLRSETKKMIRNIVNLILTALQRTMALAAIGTGLRPMYVGMVRNRIRDTVRNGLLTVIMAIDLSVRAAIAGMNIQALARRITAGINRAYRNGINRVNNNLNPPQPGNPPGPRGIGRGDLGNRADIYMHSGALRTLTGAVGAFLQPAAEMEVLKIQMEAFTGSAEKAAETVRQLQEHALVSPYSMASVTEASTLLQKYGMDSQRSVDVTRMLGDVAGGSNEKLHLLGLAIGQITALGRLQGQELRQLTEHGWNPLVTISKATGKSMAELDDLKRRGMITSEAVIAALQIETSAGGRFHDMQKRMSGSIKGLVQQINELITVIGMDFIEVMSDDIKKALNSTLEFLQGLRAWMKLNKETVREWAHFIKWLIIGIGTFHLLGLAVAYGRWMLHAFLLLMGFGQTVISAFLWVIGSLRTAFLVLTFQMSITELGFYRLWVAALGPVGALAALAAAAFIVNAAVAAMAVEFFAPGSIGWAFDWLTEKVKAFVFWIGKVTGISDILSKLDFGFPKPESVGLPPLEAPKDLDWGKMLGGPEGGEGDMGGKGYRPLPAAPVGVRAGSSEHIMRQWEYSQKLGAIRVGGSLDDPEKRKVALLEKIEQNTRNVKTMTPDLSTASTEAI